MSLDSKFKKFQEKHNLDDDAVAEILIIFNESFIELAHKLLNEVPNKTEQKPIEKKITSKKFATKIALEYAEEKEVTLDDFNKEKITKKDIDEFIKYRTSKKSSVEKKEPFKKCCGIDKLGTPCAKNGTVSPEGSTKHYCFRHAMEWKNYELSSDSDLEEEDD